jgi:hypothetical protein
MRQCSRPAISHQVAALRRQDREPKPGRAGRAVIAAPARLLQLIRLVPPATLMRWHRRLVSRGDRNELDRLLGRLRPEPCPAGAYPGDVGALV